MVYVIKSDEDNYLEHHGIKGQKWGVRRFQNEDGTRTNAGLKRDRQTKAAREGGKGKQRTGMSESTKTALKTTALMVGTAALTAGAIYGGMKVSDMVKDKAYQVTISEGEKMISVMKNSSLFWEDTLSSNNNLIEAGKRSVYNNTKETLTENARKNIQAAAKTNSKTLSDAVRTLRGNGYSGYSVSDKDRDVNKLTDTALRTLRDSDYAYDYTNINGMRNITVKKKS